MDATRHGRTAILFAAIVATMLTNACSGHTPTWSDPSAAATHAGPIGPAGPAGPNGTASPVGTASGVGTASAASHVAGDYKVVPSDPEQCDWVTDDSGKIQIGAYFIGSYSGPAPAPATVPYMLSDSVDTTSGAGTTPLGPVHLTLPAVMRTAAYTFVLTVNLRPPGVDADPADDRASISIDVPPGAPITVPEPLPCT